MKFKDYLDQVKTDKKYLNRRFTYQCSPMPQYGVGLRFVEKDGNVVPEILYLMCVDSRDSILEITDSKKVHCLSAVFDIPYEVLELACLVKRKVDQWMTQGTDMVLLNIEQDGVSTKEWNFNG